MFAKKPRTEVVIRFAMIAVMVFNAVIPTAALAAPARKPEEGQNNAANLDAPKTLPESTPLFFTPTNISSPQQTGPEPDEPKSPIPPRDSVEFSITAEPAIVPANGIVTFNVFIQNNSGQVINELIFTDQLETGLDYNPDPSSPITYDAKKREIGIVFPSLGTGDAVKFSYAVTVATSKRNSLNGKIWLHGAELATSDDSLQLETSVAIGVGLSTAETKSEFAVLRTDGGWNDLGRIQLHMEKNNVGANALVMSSPTRLKGKGPELQFKLDVYQTSSLAVDAQGRFNEQEISIMRENDSKFQNPAFLEINLDDYIDLKNIPAGQEPYVVTYDETSEVWVKVPIIEQNIENNSVVVEAAHFSTWGAGLGSSLPQNGANVLLFDQPYTSLFTGSSRYSIPIWAPAGRAGMQPDVSLSYSSGTVDGVLGDVQAPWVGVGWNMDAVEIVRKITTDANGYGYRNEFALTLNGSLYELVRDEYQQNRYYTDKAAFLYVERHGYAFDEPSTANASSEWWEVVTTDGTRYQLGRNADSEQMALMVGYSCTTNGSDCITPDGAYASLGYAGNATDMVPMRWRVDKVSDPLGNYIEYQYEEFPSTTTLAPFDRESYLKFILYTGFDAPGTASDLATAYKVEFGTISRTTFGDVPEDFNIWDNVDSKVLDSIKIICTACQTSPSNAPIRTYKFGYSLAPSPNADGTLTLTSLEISGGNYAENGQAIPLTKAPTIRFSYQDKDNRASGAGDVFKYPRLVTIDNGSGGTLTFTYEHDGRGNNSWYNYRVKNVILNGGMGVVKKQGYTYATPVYSGSGGNPNLGSLSGYTTVTESVLDFSNGDAKILDTKHIFGTTGLDTGSELQTEMLIGGTNTVLQKTVNVYVTDNSQAPFPGWNYRYLGRTTSYVNSDGVLIQTSKTTYYNDPSTGNPLIHSTYLGNTLYRKTYYEYNINSDPQYYILNKPSRVLLVGADNQIYSDTRYYYDDEIFDAELDDDPPTRGLVTLMQRLVPDDPSTLTVESNKTIDTSTGYNIYGNATSVRAHNSYGVVNTAPSTGAGTYLETKTVYAAVPTDLIQTYPTHTTVGAEINTTSSLYLATLGVPYETTDPNLWTTRTTYDGLGRTLSVTPPGLSQPGTWFIYPSPDFNGNLPAPHSVEMQILDTIAGRYRSVWGLYDGAGRMLQTQVESSSQQLLVNTTLFNSQGLAYQQSLPYNVNGTGGNYVYNAGTQFTTTSYDALGRAFSVTAPGNITSTTVYDGLTTTVIDPNGNSVARTTDGLGRMINVVEYTDSGAVYGITNYAYDKADRLIQTTDSQGNQTTLQYDWLGRKIEMNDPDMGEWFYKYDSLGNMNWQKDARGYELSFEYDELNRLKKKIDNDANTVDPTFTYSTSVGSIGLRVGMMDASGSTTWSYSNFGRTVTETRTIGGEERFITTNSDWLGRALSTTYSDGEVITYAYDELGRPDQMKSGTTTLVDLAYNTLGQITTQTLGNGTTVVTNYYDSSTTRLSQRTATTGSSTLLDVSYSYDANGNIKRLTDSSLNETHFYQYDFLSRLTQAIGVTGTPSAEPASPNVYGQRFEYDQVGNILKVVNWGTPPPTFTPTPVPTQTNTSTPTVSATLTPTPTSTSTPTSNTLTLQPDAAAGLDTYILSSSATTNYGTSNEMGVGEANVASNTVGRSLIKFDLSSIPSNATITSATLSLWTNTDYSSATRTIRVYRLKAPFNETQATWNIRATGSNWETAGASGTNDRESAEIGSVEILSNESLNTEKQITLTTAKIQELINGTFTNHGFIIVADTELNDGFLYKTSDHSTSTQRPKLVIQYTTPSGGILSDSFARRAPEPNQSISFSSPITDHFREAFGPLQQSGFPTTSVLDNFDRANGSIGSNWGGATSNYSISSNQLQVGSGGTGSEIYWNGTTFGTDQEAYFTFSQVHSSATAQGLALKAQSNTGAGNGVLEVLYVASSNVVQVWTYTPSQGQVQRGSNISATFANGDQLGARARDDGTVEVYKNGSLLATRDVTAWPYYDDPGYIGISFISANGAKVDDFGGGTYSAPATATPTPTATLTPSATPTPSVTPTPTNTLVPTNTAVPTYTPTPWSGADSYTKILLHMDGTDTSTTFTDETGKTWTPAGQSQIDTDQSKFGGASGLFDGSSDYISTGDSDEFDIGAGDFSVDFWVRWNTVEDSGIFTHGSTDNDKNTVYYDSGKIKWVFVRSGTVRANYSFDFVPVTGSWYHIAWVKNGSDVFAFLNGNSQPLTVTTAVGTNSLSGIPASFYIGRGRFNGANQYLDGHLDEFRFSNGIARWITDFTPPAAPYGNMHTPIPPPVNSPVPSATITHSPAPVSPTNTPNAENSLKAYWKFDGATGTTIPDEAPNDGYNNNGTVINGDSSTIQTYPPTNSYVYFSSAIANDYVSVAHQSEIVTNTSFTVSAWVNPSAIVTDRVQYILRKGVSAASFDYGFITTSSVGTATPTPPANVNPDGDFAFTVSDLSPNAVTGPILPVGTWTLVTGVYDSAADELRLYINGALVAVQEVTGSVNMNSAGPLTFGGPTPNQFDGSLDEVRFYNRALTGSEISALYGSSPATPTATSLPAATVTPSASPTVTPSPTTVPANVLLWGNGANGDLTIDASTTFNPNVDTNGHNGRTCADAISYSVASLGSTLATLSAAPASNCLSSGDEILLINLKGLTATSYNIGEYEFLRVKQVTGNTVEFTTMKTRWYGDGWHSDANIGTGTNQVRVMLMRVPNYEDVIVNGTLKASAFDGNLYGVLAFRVSGTLTGSQSTGVISADAIGFGNGTGYGKGGSVALNLGKNGGGAGYATGGGVGGSGTGHGSGGSAYGLPPLGDLFLGSGGGQAGYVNEDSTCGGGGGNTPYPCVEQVPGPGGGRGGGAIFIAAQTINFTGVITSKGTDKTTNAETNLKGGAGSGGSIYIQGGNTITLGTVSALGGSQGNAYGYGGNGRIAVYRETTGSIAPFTSNPANYSGVIGQTPVIPTATPISTILPPSPYGNGRDGNLTVAAGDTFNLSADYSGSRTCADGISYSVLEITSSNAKLSSAPTNACLAPGDEILIANVSSSGPNVGNTEFLRVGAVIGDMVYFQTPKANFYGENAEDDTNIGSGLNQQRVMIVRVPNYSSVTLETDAILTTDAYSSTTFKDGILAFRVSGTLSGTSASTITADSKGYYHATGLGKGGTADYDNGWGDANGGGGGYATNGGDGADTANHSGGAGGATYGDVEISNLFLGSGGGNGGVYVGSPAGGRGGGAIFIAAQTITFSGSITAKGADIPQTSGAKGGAGSGGSIRIEGGAIELGTLAVEGGSPASGYGYGGSGRVAIYHSGTLANESTLCQQTSVHCWNTGAATPTPTATVSATPGVPGFDAFTKSLLHMDGADASTSFIDSSNKTWTANGNAQIDTTQSKFGGASALFDGNGDYIATADHTDFDFGDDDFTLDLWVRLNSIAATQTILTKRATSSAYGPFLLRFNDSGDKFEFYASKNGTTWGISLTSSTTASANTWYHLAAVRHGDVWTLYVNGVSVDSETVSATLTTNTTNVTIGGNADASHPLNGWVDEVRVSKGIPRWTSNFTPPSAPYSGYGAPPTATPTVDPSAWTTHTYAYAGTQISGTPYPQPHAVTSVGRVSFTDTFTYDQNGNMICRIENGVTYTHTYNRENRASSIARRNGDCTTGTILESWSFAYDGDGNRVTTAHFTGASGTPDSTTRYYFGGSLESTDGAVTKYYSFAGQTIAMKEGSAFKYFVSDHLGSTSLVLNESGTILEQQRYLPFGAPRSIPSFNNITSTDITYTGQRKLDDGMGGIMDYKARFYSPYINRFLQPDTIVSDPYNPQAWNRYAYVLNNPIRYNDPTGHEVCWEGSEPGGRCLDAAGFIKNDLESDYNIKITGGWDKDELLLLTTSLNKLAAYAGGADNLNDIFQDALKNNNVNSDRLVFSNQKQENCPGDDAQACWRYWEGTVSFSDAVFSGQYQFRPGAFRPVELGLKGNLEASIQVTMIHEMVHVFADARPPAAKIYSWRVPIPGTDSEERMANTIAFYVVSGKQNWPGRPNHFDFVRDITALWQATP